MISKNWRAVAYEENGKRFEAPDAQKNSRIHYFEDHSVEYIHPDKGKRVGDWQYEDRLKKMTIVDRETKDTMNILVKSLSERELVCQIGNPGDRLIHIIMQPE